MQQWESASSWERCFGAMGFVYGDGTLANFGRTSMVRLCGDKTNTLVVTSLGFKVSYPKSANRMLLFIFSSYGLTP